MDPSFYSHLASVGMERYFDVFRDYGVENVEDIGIMIDADFTACGVKPFHRRKLLALVQTSALVAESVLSSQSHRFLFEPLFLPNDKREDELVALRKEEEQKRVEECQARERQAAEEIRARELQAADERRAREESEMLARFAVESSAESESDEWEVVGRKKIEARQAEQAARDAAKIRRAEEEKNRRAAEEKEERRRAEEENARQAKAESERRRMEKARVKALTVTAQPKAVTTPKAKKTKKKPRPPGNLCLQWKTKGECTYLLAGTKCSFEHPEEWRGGK